MPTWICYKKEYLIAITINKSYMFNFSRFSIASRRLNHTNIGPHFINELMKYTVSEINTEITGVILTLEGGSEGFPSFSWSIIFRFAEERVGYRRRFVFEVIGVSSSIRGLPFCFEHDLVTAGIFHLHLR